MTELEHAEKLTGESGARPAFNRAIQRIPPGAVELMRKLEATAERNQQSVADCATLDITHDAEIHLVAALGRVGDSRAASLWPRSDARKWAARKY